MEGYKSRVGKDQMRQYMGGMYENSMVVFREYLQNACDAVELALREKLIDNRRQANIAVSLDQYNKTITIEDVGIGISRKNIGDYLVSVASSNKYKKGLVGKHGIGRLNGANYCDQIIYETSFAGEPIKSTLIWDVNKARKICDDDSLDWDVTQIIDTVTHLKEAEPEDPDKHYCKVTLVNVNDPRLLESNLVKQYVEQIVSVDYSTEFKDNVRNPALLKAENASYKQRFDDLWVYQVSVDNIPIQKTYASEYDDKILGGMQLFVLRDDKTQEELAWGWFALNRRAEQLNGLPFSYIRARHHNFQIGRDDLLNAYHKNSTAPSYVIGELHITNPNIEPTGTRDGIEGGVYKEKLKLALQKLFSRIYSLYDKASHFKSDVVENIGKIKIEIANQKLILKSETDPNECKKIKDIIKDKDNKIKSIYEDKLPRYQTFFEERSAWDVAQDIVDAVNEGIIKNYNTSAKIEKADAQIKDLNLDDFKPSAPTKHTNPVNTTTSPSNNERPNDNPNSHTNSPSTPNLEQSTENTVPNEMDAYKTLSTVEKSIVRKVLSVINSMTDIPDKQKQKLKNKLQKRIVNK